MRDRDRERATEIVKRFTDPEGRIAGDDLTLVVRIAEALAEARAQAETEARESLAGHAKALDEVAYMRPVVEAALAWATAQRAHDENEGWPPYETSSLKPLHDAVAEYRRQHPTEDANA